jgi:hypothetical protein
MIDTDLAQFSKVLDSLSEYYQRDPLSPMAVKIYFSALERFPIESIGDAVNAHIQHPTGGKFYPKAADLILHLEGGEIKVDQIVAAAKLAETPLGIMAKIHIGSWDLNRLNSFDLKQRAEEVLQLLPAWKVAAAAGEYTDHQITIMIKHGVDPCQPFYMGLAAPLNREALVARIAHVTGTKRHQELLEAPYQEQSTASTGTTQVAEIARGIGRLEKS